MKIFVLLIVFVSQVFALRIVSLAPPATNQLIALGVDSLIVGRTSFCTGSENSEIIGCVINISGERILSLRPDIVIASDLTNSSLVERLRRVNIEVLVVNDPHNYAHLRQNFRSIAEAVGVLDKADSILSITDKRIAEIIEQNSTLSNRPRVFVQISTNPIFTLIRNTLAFEMIEVAGGENAFNLDGGGVVSREAVIAKNPDVIIVADMMRASQEEIRRWKSFTFLSAAQNNAIFIIDGDRIGSPSPTSFVETVEYIRELLKK